MATYVWAGHSLGGERKTGELAAETQADALRELRRMRIVVSSVRP